MTGTSQTLCVRLRSSAAYQAATYRGVPFERFYVFHKDNKDMIPKIFMTALMWACEQRLNDGQKGTIAERVVNTVEIYTSGKIPENFTGIKTNQEDYLLVLPLQYYKARTALETGGKIVWHLRYLAVKSDRVNIEYWLQKAMIFYHGKWESACARCPNLFEHITSRKSCGMSANGCKRYLRRADAPREEKKGMENGRVHTVKC